MCAMSLSDLVPTFVFLFTVKVAVTQRPQSHFLLLENFDHHSLSRLSMISISMLLGKYNEQLNILQTKELSLHMK